MSAGFQENRITFAFYVWATLNEHDWKDDTLESIRTQTDRKCINMFNKVIKVMPKMCQ